MILLTKIFGISIAVSLYGYFNDFQAVDYTSWIFAIAFITVPLSVCIKTVLDIKKGDDNV